MELISFTGNLVRRQWRKSGGYTRLSPTNRRNVKIARFGSAAGNSPKRRPSWGLRLTRKLRLVRLKSASPLRLLRSFKNAYMKMMLRLADATGTSNGCNIFGEKRVPKARGLPMAYSRTEFENRLILEICKSMTASLELGYNK